VASTSNASARLWPCGSLIAKDRALTTKFTSSTNYAAARTGTIAAARELAPALGADYSAQVAAI
jgi:Zn-dependent metalloprotease